MGTWRRVQRWYGFGPDRAELVLRLKLWILILLYPLLPVLLYVRIEVRGNTVTAFGKVLGRGPIDLGAQRTVRSRSAYGNPLYSVICIDQGERQLSVAPSSWTHWRALLERTGHPDDLDATDDADDTGADPG